MLHSWINLHKNFLIRIGNFQIKIGKSWTTFPRIGKIRKNNS
jgi:hypothetical protein